jgi:hypothetical protein
MPTIPIKRKYIADLLPRFANESKMPIKIKTAEMLCTITPLSSF